MLTRCLGRLRRLFVPQLVSLASWPPGSTRRCGCALRGLGTSRHAAQPTSRPDSPCCSLACSDRTSQGA